MEQKQELDIMKDTDIVAAIKLVINEFKREERETKRKMVYHNTYLLMKNYNKLKAHIEDIQDKAIEKHLEDLDIDVEFKDLQNEGVWIINIARSKIKSIMMVSYIDTALSIIEKEYKVKGIHNEFLAFKLYFIDGLTNDEIVSHLNCGKNSPKRWSDKVLNELGVLLWGVEAIEL